MKFAALFAMSQDKVKEIMNAVGEKCKTDENFAQELRNNPTQMLQKEGLQFQPGISVQLIKTENEATLLPDNVIPISFGITEDSLSVDVLDKVVGGAKTHEEAMKEIQDFVNESNKW